MVTFWIIILMVVLSAIFSGLEIAYITSDKMLIEMNSNKPEDKVNKILSIFVKNPSRFIATLLIGNNLALVIYGIYMDKALTPILGGMISNSVLMLIFQTIISTILILVFAEFLPKTLFRILKNKVLAIFAFPMFGFYWISKWVVNFFVYISKFLLKKFFKIEIEEDKPIFSRVELEEYLETRTDMTSLQQVDNEVVLYKNALDFSSVKVKECMVPRNEIEAVSMDTSIEKIKEIFIDTGYSKIIIYKDSIDEIVGFVHIYELFKNPNSIKDVLLPVGYIPQTLSAQNAMNNFIKQRKSVFIVVDEFGGTAGMLTIEDLMEEIFGEIEDEHDVQEHIEEKMDESTFVFSGRLEIDYINEKYSLNIQTSDAYETLAGFIFNQIGKIPSENEELKSEEYSFVVEKVSDTKIELVKVIKNEIL
jgi:CBS domain containing-hemolysin-like protein